MDASETFGFHTDRLSVLLFIAVFFGLVAWFLWRTRRGAQFYIRRIPGIDAIEDALGRATEMGRPVLYVPGVEEMYDIQTIASVLILGPVAERIARYGADLIVSCMIPFVMTVSQEVVKQSYSNAGRPEAFKQDNIRYISYEQFAFAAGTNGIMMRERPATNFFFGRFYAESLMLAETGLQTGAVQIAATAEISQLPFFIVTCDFTLLGEELFAASAYLSKEPKLLSTLKAADWTKVAVIGLILIGVVTHTIWADADPFFNWFTVK